MIVDKRVRCRREGFGLVAERPVVGNFVVVKSVQPGQRGQSRKSPGRRGIGSAVFRSIVAYGRGQPQGNINVNW